MLIYSSIYLFEFPKFIEFCKYFEYVFEILRQKEVLNNKMDTFHVFATSLQRKVFSFEFVVYCSHDPTIKINIISLKNIFYSKFFALILITFASIKEVVLLRPAL